jgi:hypothetical protein
MYSIREIARMRGVAHTTIRWWVKRHGLQELVQSQGSQYWLMLRAGKITQGGELVNERISCGCGCGATIWRWYWDSQGHRRERRCLKWHKFGGRSTSKWSKLNRQKRRRTKREIIDYPCRSTAGNKNSNCLYGPQSDPIAVDDLTNRQNDTRTRLAIDVAKKAAGEKFHLYVGVAWLALDEASQDSTIDAEELATVAVKREKRADGQAQRVPSIFGKRHTHEDELLAREDPDLEALLTT